MRLSKSTFRTEILTMTHWLLSVKIKSTSAYSAA